MKNDSIIKLLTPDDCTKVAELHLRAFTDSVLSKLGHEAVVRYYQRQFSDAPICVAVGAFSRDNQMKGFIFAGYFRGAISDFIYQNRTFIIRQLILHPRLIFHPFFGEKVNIGMKAIMPKKSVQKSAIKKNWSPTFWVLSIAVDPIHERSGNGHLLMHYIEQAALKRGFTCIYLTVHPTNERGVRFYESLGWKRIENKNAWNGRMYKQLDSELHNYKG